VTAEGAHTSQSDGYHNTFAVVILFRSCSFCVHIVGNVIRLGFEVLESDTMFCCMVVIDVYSSSNLGSRVRGCSYVQLLFMEVLSL